MSGKAKRRTRKRPRRLSAAEIAEIDELIAQRRQETRQETEWECQDIILQEERERQILLRADHSVGPWPEPARLGPRTTLGDGDYVYVREGGEDEVPAGHPFLREVARRDGMIRYAWTGGLTFDLSQTWKQDPSWQFVITRLEGVPANDWDRVIDKAIDDLLDTNIPLSQGTKQYIKEDRHSARTRSAGSTTETASSHAALPVSLIGSWSCCATRASRTRRPARRNMRLAIGARPSSKIAAARASPVARRSPHGCGVTVTRQKTPRKCRASAGARSIPTRADRDYLCVS